MTGVLTPFVEAATMVCGPAIGFVLAGATWHKLFEPTQFRATIAEYRIMPPAIAPLAARAIVFAEGLVAAALLVSPWPGIAGLAAAALLLVYTAAIGVNLVRGRIDLECGCGFEPSTISLGKVVANLGLVALALAAASAPPATGGVVWTSVRLVALNAVIVSMILPTLWRSVARSAEAPGATP